MSLAPGSVIGGRYLVEGQLGAGGFATVWRARHLLAGTAHAIKVLHSPDPEAARRLLEEGQLASRLNHPNLVAVTDLVDLPGGVALVMELIDGPTLRQRLARGRPSLAEARALGDGVLEGVAAVHRAGMLHRDLKAENVLIDPDGRPRVTDFGLGRARERAGAITRAGLAMGTPGAMAPECYVDAASAGPPADVFALGCLLYELLSGARPFPAELPWLELLRRARAEDYAPLPSDLPVEISRVVTAALHAEIQLRPPDAVALLAAWRGAPSGLRTPAIAVATPSAPTPLRSAPLDPGFKLPDLSLLTAAPQPATASASPAPPAAPPRDLLYGRDMDLARLLAALEDAGLVTLRGPAGVGKSRLADELARTWTGAETVVWASLAEVEDPEALLGAVSEALGVTLGGRDAAARLGDALSSRGPLLLILDGLDRAAGAAGPLLTGWRAAAPALRVLVTARVALRLDGERVLDLAPLALPMGDPRLSPAVALFVARARAANPALGDLDLEAVGALVSQLDGLPLAIELAAARCRILSLDQILARMERRFVLLGGGAGGGARLSLHASLSLSWELLTEDDRSALASLSVFAGSFSLEAAEAVLGFEAMDRLDALVGRSLLVVQRPGRFAMLACVRDYAAGQRAAGQGVADAEARHLRFFAAAGEDEAIASLTTRGGEARRIALGQEHRELVLACRRAIEQGQPEPAMRCLLAAWHVCSLSGLATTVVGLAQEILALPLRAAWRARVAFCLGEALLPLGRLDEVKQAMHAAIEAGQAAADGGTVARAHVVLAQLAQGVGEIAETRRHVEAAFACDLGADRFGHRPMLLRVRGLLALREGRLDEAEASMTAAIDAARARGSTRALANTLGSLGSVRMAQGRPAEAAALTREAVDLFRITGDGVALGMITSDLATICLVADDLDGARRAAAEATVLLRAQGMRLVLPRALGNAAEVLRREGRLAEAQATLAEAMALAEAAGARKVLPHLRQYEAQILEDLGDHAGAAAAWARAIAGWRAMDLREDAAEALLGLARFRLRRGELGPARAAALEALACAEGSSAQGVRVATRALLSTIDDEQ